MSSAQPVLLWQAPPRSLRQRRALPGYDRRSTIRASGRSSEQPTMWPGVLGYLGHVWFYRTTLPRLAYKEMIRMSRLVSLLRDFRASEFFRCWSRRSNWLSSLGKTSLAWLSKAKQSWSVVTHLMDHVG